MPITSLSLFVCTGKRRTDISPYGQFSVRIYSPDMSLHKQTRCFYRDKIPTKLFNDYVKYSISRFPIYTIYTVHKVIHCLWSYAKDCVAGKCFTLRRINACFWLNGGSPYGGGCQTHLVPSSVISDQRCRRHWCHLSCADVKSFHGTVSYHDQRPRITIWESVRVPVLVGTIWVSMGIRLKFIMIAVFSQL